MRRVQPVWIGAFVVGAVTLLVAGLMLFGGKRMSRDARTFVVYFRRSVSGLDVDAPVRFKGILVGRVTGIYLRLPESNQAADDYRIPVTFAIDPKLVRERGAKFDIADPKVWRALIDDGLRAELAVSSYVTGTRFISLDMHPGTPVDTVEDTGIGYPQIPRFSGGVVEEIQGQVGKVLDNLASVDFAGLTASIEKTANSFDQLVNSPRTNHMLDALDTATVRLAGTLKGIDRLADTLATVAGGTQRDMRETLVELRATLKGADSTLASLRDAIGAGSPTAVHLQSALDELGGAARAMRILAEYLDRNPDALLRGRPAPQEKK